MEMHIFIAIAGLKERSANQAATERTPYVMEGDDQAILTLPEYIKC